MAYEAAVFWLIYPDRPGHAADATCHLTTFTADETRWCDVGGRPDAGPLVRIYEHAAMAVQGWQAMEGDNAPLRRPITGTCNWDFNLDGLGNYAMLPDFLQYLRNVGVNARQRDTLFACAEDYLQMWERAELARLRVPPFAHSPWAERVA